MQREVVGLSMGPETAAAEMRTEASSLMRGASTIMQETTSTRPTTMKELPVKDLPHVWDRIHELGLTDEYIAYRDRFMAWRKGEARGAKGEIAAEEITRPEHHAQNRGFSTWYPTASAWRWSRTISFWISVLFFEGAIFFAVSCFLGDYKAVLGVYANDYTLYGLCGGKLCFFLCCYLMCLEVVNTSAGAEVESDTSPKINFQKGKQTAEEEIMKYVDENFSLNPFNHRQAFERLDAAELGRLARFPFYTCVMYLLGVLVFAVALLAQLLPCPEGWEEPLVNWSFLFGSILFASGGFCECIQNNTFTSLDIHKGWVGALLNFIGGLLFMLGSIFDWMRPDLANQTFGWGSVMYIVASSIQIIMWKDEQFGLTFFAVMNIKHLHVDEAKESKSRFSMQGAAMVHVCCWCGAMSVYNMNVELSRYFLYDSWRSLQYALYEFLPFLFVHAMLALSSAVLRSPKQAPFRELYYACRVLGFLLALISTSTFVLYIREAMHSH